MCFADGIEHKVKKADMMQRDGPEGKRCRKRRHTRVTVNEKKEKKKKTKPLAGVECPF
jgi:hypothetical protein